MLHTSKITKNPKSSQSKSKNYAQLNGSLDFLARLKKNYSGDFLTK